MDNFVKQLHVQQLWIKVMVVIKINVLRRQLLLSINESNEYMVRQTIGNLSNKLISRLLKSIK